MSAMIPRIPTASQSVGTSYNRATAYDSPLTYNQASTVGAIAFVVKPTSSTSPRSVASSSMTFVVKPTPSTSPRTLSTASIKPR